MTISEDVGNEVLIPSALPSSALFVEHSASWVTAERQEPPREQGIITL